MREATGTQREKALPVGTLREWHWRAMALAWKSRPEGVQDETGSYGSIGWNTWLRLRDYKAGALIEEYQTWPESRPVYWLRLTPFGELFSYENWRRYRDLYPGTLPFSGSTTFVPVRVLPTVSGWLRGRERHKPNRCTRSRISTSLRILDVLPVSRPGVPRAIIPGSRPGAMEPRPNCMARSSDGLSKDGCKPGWTGDASKECRSHRYLHSSLLIPQMGSGLLTEFCPSAHMGGQVLTSEGKPCSLGRTFTTWPRLRSAFLSAAVCPNA